MPETRDIALVWDDTLLLGDVVARGTDLAVETGLNSAVLISLFSDRRASADDLPQGETERRGWWGDALEDDDRIGSLLWTLRREKQTTEVLRRAESHCGEALAWLAEDGLAQSVTVEASWVGRGVMCIDVAVLLADGRLLEFQFTDALTGE